MTSKTLPITILGGYLGAGKTTLLNYIIRHTDRRLAIIVNDFGDINIDADLIESQDGDTTPAASLGGVINLSNGCICCSLVDGFTVALLSLQKLETPPEHVIVEASGVADPYELGQQGRIPGFRLDGVIVLADAETIRKKTKDKYVGETVTRQLRGADLLVLNKIDLLDEKDREPLRAWTQNLAPDVRIIEASYGVVPLPLLLGIGADHDEFSSPVLSHTHHHHDQDYASWSYTSETPLDGEKFREMVKSLPDGILRAKGILYLQENPNQRQIFQLVGKRWSIEAGEPWGDTRPESKIVAIGLRDQIHQDVFSGLMKGNHA